MGIVHICACDVHTHLVQKLALGVLLSGPLTFEAESLSEAA